MYKLIPNSLIKEWETFRETALPGAELGPELEESKF